jgi:hypothetical protein
MGARANGRVGDTAKGLLDAFSREAAASVAWGEALGNPVINDPALKARKNVGRYWKFVRSAPKPQAIESPFRPFAHSPARPFAHSPVRHSPARPHPCSRFSSSATFASSSFTR